MYEETKENIAKLSKKIGDIEDRARNQNRPLSAKEAGLVMELEEAIDEERKDLPVGSPLSLQNFNGRSGRTAGPFASLGEQLLAIRQAGLPSGRVDPRLYEIRAAASGLNETVPSEGGFLVQQDYSNEILQDTFEVAQLARLCRKQPIGANANSIKINGVDETSRETSRFGGVVSYWIDEAGEKQASKPKFREINLNLRKNVVLIYATDELLSDAAALEAFIRQAAPQEIAFNVDDCIIRGTGAGQPLGILNAGCLVTVAAEAGQHVDTIIAENVIHMVKRTLGPSRNYVWLHSKTILDQIYSLSLAVGTGGIPLFIAGGSLPNFPENRLLGLPLMECEQCAQLGDVGDLILADLRNGYIIADKGNVKTDVSIHVRFVYDESVFRFVYRVDGQPARASALTPFKGGATNTQSHFIALAAR